VRKASNALWHWLSSFATADGALTGSVVVEHR
jgi:hypothetical protein